jgi:hypothetical protein
VPWLPELFSAPELERIHAQTDGGDLLYVRSRAVRHGSAEVLERLARGEDVDASEYIFRTSTQIE